MGGTIDRWSSLPPHTAWGLSSVGEHLLCKQGVTGSNPVASTKSLLKRPQQNGVSYLFGSTNAVVVSCKVRVNPAPSAKIWDCAPILPTCLKLCEIARLVRRRASNFAHWVALALLRLLVRGMAGLLVSVGDPFRS